MPERITFPDARPGMPLLVFDDEAQRERALKALGEAIGNAEASLPFCENPTMVRAAIERLKTERTMAQEAMTLATWEENCICPRECSCEKPPLYVDMYCPEHGDDDVWGLPGCPAKKHWWETPMAASLEQ